MGWIKRKLIAWAEEDDCYNNIRCPEPLKTGFANSLQFKNPMNITIYSVIGGKIVKFTSYSISSDEPYENTYLIPADDDFETALCGFILIETMKHGQE